LLYVGTMPRESDATDKPAGAQGGVGDDSHDLDLVAVFSSDLHNAQMEAMGICAVLEAAGIPAVINSTSMYPSCPFEVRVPRASLDAARQIIEEARLAGPEAAEEAEEAEQENLDESGGGSPR